MGQRSQIYIRWKKEDGDYVLIARYFQWNYAERMVSRARALIERLKADLMFDYQFNGDESFYKKITKFCDVNFDFRDIVNSYNILEEFKEHGENKSFKDFVFLNQYNNDGKLFIEADAKKKIIKYCFTDYDMKLLDCRKYMEWDYNMWQNDIDTEHYSYTMDNLEAIERNAKLMTKSELKKFIDFDYKLKEIC